MSGDKAAMSARQDTPAPETPEKKIKKTRGGFFGAPAASDLNDSSSRRSTFLGG